MNKRTRYIMLISSVILLLVVIIFATNAQRKELKNYDADLLGITNLAVTTAPVNLTNKPNLTTSVYNKDAVMKPETKKAVAKTTPQPAPKKTTVTANQDMDKKNFSLKGLDNKTYTLTDYRDKLVFVNFWATWCTYCVIEMPDLITANKRLTSTGKGLVLAVDVKESASKVKSFVASKKWSGITYLLDTDGAVASKYRVTGFPSTFVFYKGKQIKNWGYMIDSKTINGLIDDVLAGKYD